MVGSNLPTRKLIWQMRRTSPSVVVAGEAESGRTPTFPRGGVSRRTHVGLCRVTVGCGQPRNLAVAQLLNEASGAEGKETQQHRRASRGVLVAVMFAVTAAVTAMESKLSGHHKGESLLTYQLAVGALLGEEELGRGSEETEKSCSASGGSVQ